MRPGKDPGKNSVNRQQTWQAAKRIWRYAMLPDIRWAFFGSAALIVMLAATTASKAYIVQPVMDTFQEGNATRDDLLLLCGIVTGIFATSAILNWAQMITSRFMAFRLVTRIREDVVNHLLGQSLGYFQTRRLGDLASRSVNDLQTLGSTLTNSLQHLFTNICLVVMLIGMIFVQDWRLALMCGAILLVTGLLLKAMSRRLHTLGRKMQEATGAVVTDVADGITGVELVITFGLVRRWREKFRELGDALEDRSMDAMRVQASSISAMLIILAVGIGALVYVAGSALLDGDVTLGEFMSIVAALYLLQTPAQSIGDNLANLARGLAAGERALELLNDPLTVEEPEKPAAVPAATDDPIAVSFDGVSFGYGDTKVLDELSFDVKAGEVVVMVGDSGAGKSTIAKMMLRFYDPWSGGVRLHGTRVDELQREDLPRLVSYVSQDVFLFNGTLEFNLRIGRPDATEEEIRRALEVACVDEFFERLPDGLQTNVGGPGRASLGRPAPAHRDRARAVLTEAPILVLDEATSALDMDLERRILENLVRSHEGRSLFAITHRLSMAELADRVIVLKRGQLEEQGSALELAARPDGEYARLRRAAGAPIDAVPAESGRESSPT